MLVTDRAYFVLAAISSDPFDYINGTMRADSVDANGVTTDGIILGMGMSWIKLMEALGAIGLVVSLIICAYKFIVFKNNPREMTETKKEAIYKIMIAIVIFAFIGLAGVAFDLGASFTG